MPLVLITGANRGIGLELARQYAEDGWNVLATCRDPDQAGELREIAKQTGTVEVEALDVTDGAQVRALASRLCGRAIDVLLNNAGIIGPYPAIDHIHMQHFGSIDYDLWDEIMRVNTYGPVRMAEALVENVAMSEQRKIVTLSSTVGSIAEMKLPAMAYATSKTAVNKAMSLLAEQVRHRGIAVAVLCPGYTKTRMNLGGAPVEVPDSAAGVRKVIDALTMENTGSFTSYTGAPIRW